MAPATCKFCHWPEKVAVAAEAAVRKLGQSTAAHLRQRMRDKRIEHRQYVVAHGEDMPEVRDWKWPSA